MGVATLLTCLLLGVGVDAAKEPRTGISFPDKYKGGVLTRLGVRTKGPIKVYGVGQYDSGTFMLKMSYGVSAQKMSSALADALKPRCSDAKLIQEFEDCLLKGLPNGAPKGTCLVFATSGGKLSVSVNDKAVGAIGSKAICTAFSNIYCDKNAVCQMSAVGDEDSASANGFLTAPRKGAIFGAAVGYGLAKVLA